MKNFKELLPTVKAFAFDVDGVLSSSITYISPEGQLLRSANIKDGYIIQLVRKKGYPVAIISGGNFEGVRTRFENLGVEDIFLSSYDKLPILKTFIEKYNLKPEDVLYMGDDIPDIDPMKYVGVPVCPSDAAEDIKAVSRYISDKTGGHGCVRDVLEQVLRSQNNWLTCDDQLW